MTLNNRLFLRFHSRDTFFTVLPQTCKELGGIWPVR